jgi:hypothetical protein
MLSIRPFFPSWVPSSTKSQPLDQPQPDGNQAMQKHVSLLAVYRGTVMRQRTAPVMPPI